MQHARPKEQANRPLQLTERAKVIDLKNLQPSTDVLEYSMTLAVLQGTG